MKVFIGNILIMEIEFDHETRTITKFVDYDTMASDPIFNKSQRTYNSLEKRLQYVLHSVDTLPKLLTKLPNQGIAYWYNVKFEI